MEQANKPIIKQSLKQQFNESISIARSYYSIISAFNNAGLTNREIQFVAFTAVHKDVSSLEKKEKFCKEYDTTLATVNNMISKLRKTGWLVKKNGERTISVHPAISLNFDNDIIVELKMMHGKTN